MLPGEIPCHGGCWSVKLERWPEDKVIVSNYSCSCVWRTNAFGFVKQDYVSVREFRLVRTDFQTERRNIAGWSSLSYGWWSVQLHRSAPHHDKESHPVALLQFVWKSVRTKHNSCQVSLRLKSFWFVKSKECQHHFFTLGETGRETVVCPGL